MALDRNDLHGGLNDAGWWERRGQNRRAPAGAAKSESQVGAASTMRPRASA
jgi:hypothetical protein